MRYLVKFLMPVLLLITLPASAADITSLAQCATKVFKEINRTQKWTGQAPAGCPAQVAVEKRADGIFITVWAVEPAADGWVRTAFSAAAGYAEIADKKALAKAASDIMARAGRLGRCLDSIKTVNDPRECRSRATKSYLAGEVTGTENDRIIRLDDNGRHTVVQYSFGDTSATPTPPADLYESTPLPPMIIDLHR
ncbi:MAG: hypothetical protein FD174_3748 [Geobacteraceae bacterium]|nr:MAG: hypothetical protein FD174_3748 [Geobacteraceae bacterium]